MLLQTHKVLQKWCSSVHPAAVLTYTCSDAAAQTACATSFFLWMPRLQVQVSTNDERFMLLAMQCRQKEIAAVLPTCCSASARPDPTICSWPPTLMNCQMWLCQAREHRWWLLWYSPPLHSMCVVSHVDHMHRQVYTHTVLR